MYYVFCIFECLRAPRKMGKCSLGLPSLNKYFIIIIIIIIIIIQRSWPLPLLGRLLANKLTVLLRGC